MKVLLAIDDSECSLVALEWIAERKWAPESEFLVLLIVPRTFAPFHASAGDDSPEKAELKERLAVGEQLVKEQSHRLQKALPNNYIEGILREGDPTEIILEVADQEDIDLIVVGSHGRFGLEKFLHGSVSEAVASRAHCSVHIVRKSAEDSNTAPL